jgi:hypothetical protein
MAKVTDPLDSQELNLQEDEELVNLFQDEQEPQQQEEQQEAAQVETTATQEPESTVPDKYQGKSIEEIVQMHQEAEKLVGRQSSEVGELRKIVDDFIKTKAEETKQEISPNNSMDDEVDFFDNPKEAVARAVAGSTEMKQMQELLAAQKQQEVLGKISAKHPDYMEVIQDPAFGEWVKSSTVRVELLQRADNYDFNAADELLTVWSERKEVVNKAKEVNEQDRKQQRKAATTGGKGSGEPISRKIYKRSDIVQLMISDPERYKANVDEFDRAYREGRVK